MAIAEMLRLTRMAALLLCGRESAPQPNGRNGPSADLSLAGKRFAAATHHRS